MNPKGERKQTGGLVCDDTDLSGKLIVLDSPCEGFWLRLWVRSQCARTCMCMCT